MRRQFASRLSCLLLGLLPAGLGLFGSGEARAALPGSGFARGFPLIREVIPSAKEAKVQNFGVATDRRGLVYVANEGGLLIYDGAWWRALPIGKAKAAFSVTSDAAGRVAVGGVDELGILETSASGELRFVSLLNLLPPGERQVGQVGDVFATPRGFLFFTLNALIEWDGTKITTLARPAAGPPYPGAFEVGGEIYMSDSTGIFKRAGDRFERIPGGDRFAGKRVDQILPAPGGLLVSVRGGGLFLLHPIEGGVTPFAPEASAWTSANRLQGGASCRLSDGRWALGSYLGGLLLLRPDGMIDQIIDTRLGLPDNYVSGVAVDAEGGLWLALNSGIVRVEVGSPISTVDRRSGLDGSVYAVTRHRGKIWAATPSGTFAQEPWDSKSGILRLKKVEGLPPAGWSLLSMEDGLLVGTAFGIYLVPDSGAPSLVPGSDAVGTPYTLVRSGDPRRVWVGGDHGLASLAREADGWRVVPSAAGPDAEVRSIVDSGDTVWFSVPLAGIFGLELAPGAPGNRTGAAAPSSLRRISDSEGTYLYRIAGRIAAVRSNHVLRLDEGKNRLVEDSAFAPLGVEGDFVVLAEDAAGNVWRNSRPPAVFLRQGAGWASTPRWLVEVPARAIETMFADADGPVWLAGENGLYRVESPLPTAAALPAPRFARVTTGRGEFQFGGIAAPTDIELPRGFTRLEIELAPLSFRAGLRYATRLDPIDAEWSEPRAEPKVELTRLPAGRYTFRARTVGPNGEQSPEATWVFRVLPAWYETAWAIALWAALALAGIWTWASLRSRALRQRAAHLERQVQEQTAELRQAVADLERTQSDLETANVRLEELSLQDELTGIANRRRLQMLLDAEWHRSRRQHQPIAFILLDLDHFKRLNDTRGHLEGDFCLQSVAAYLAQAIQRTGDLVARYGGEEFAVLLPATDLAGALKVAERLREGLETLALPHEAVPEGHVTASFGVAAFTPLLGQEPEELIEAADLALYRAKSDGRNLVRAGGVDEETGEMDAGLTN
ncbi:MAG TPA: diguanylate cyclase [Thermoanaerobaculia bacterium]|jgi:diguanylate cyclase (GGDEF)-like protein|nr:diguanylate cyclase [Thermoanaerobaculia bacterium]